MRNLQFRRDNAYYLQHPERVVGAVRYRVDDNRIRIDTTQHTIDALTKVASVFSDEDLEMPVAYWRDARERNLDGIWTRS